MKPTPTEAKDESQPRRGMTTKTYPDRGWLDHYERLFGRNKNAPMPVGALGKNKHNNGKHTRQLAPRQHWRNQIDDTGAYYRKLFPTAKPNAEGRALVRCVFHEDKHPSLGINFDHGGWICFASCGRGDLVSFVMRHRSVEFKEALQILGVKS